VKLVWTTHGWDDYLHWQTENQKIVRKINALLKDVVRSPFQGLGKPEALKGDRAGYWSRRIDDEHRLVYRVGGKGPDQFVEISQCRYHY
jgi:toxin YoeB